MIRAATYLARERGLENFSVRDVTQALGLSKSMLYQHFASMDELVAEMLLEYAAGLLREAREIGKGERKGLRRLTRVLDMWVRDYVMQKGGCLILRGAIECAGRRDDDIRQAAKVAAASWRAFLREQLQDTLARGELPGTANPGQILFEIYSCALGIQHDCMFLGEPVGSRSSALAGILDRHGARLPAAARAEADFTVPC